MIDFQPPTPNIQLESICWDSGGLGIGNMIGRSNAALMSLKIAPLAPMPDGQDEHGGGRESLRLADQADREAGLHDVT